MERTNNIYIIYKYINDDDDDSQSAPNRVLISRIDHQLQIF